MLVLAIDLETTGLCFEKDRITEVGAVLWDTEKKKPIEIYSAFVDVSERPPISKEIESLTGITEELLKYYGTDFHSAYSRIHTLAEWAQYIVAHNGANFDKPMLAAHCKRLALPMPSVPWIDTSKDIPYPEKITTRKLEYLAAAHGFLNPFSHRAVFDVLTMLKVMSCYEFSDVEAYSKQKDVLLRAVVSFEEKDLAKELSYRWDGQRKLWLKTVKESQVPGEVERAKFKIVIMEEK